MSVCNERSSAETVFGFRKYFVELIMAEISGDNAAARPAVISIRLLDKKETTGDSVSVFNFENIDASSLSSALTVTAAFRISVLVPVPPSIEASVP